MDEGTKKQLQSIPLLVTRASPRDKELWVQRLKEELMALIKVSFCLVLVPAFNLSSNLIPLQYVQNNKASDSDWFRLESNKEGTKWFGKCWYVHNLLKYEFDVEFDVSS